MQLEFSKLQNLVVVAGHAVYTGTDFCDPAADGNWYLQPFQKGEPPFYIEHINAGVEQASLDESALLVFSGGQTRAEAGPKSEGLSYWQIADVQEWYGQESVKGRATTEEYARDSLENLLFSVRRFQECCGHLPTRIKVVGWGFKAERFELHRQALGIPLSHFEYVGVNEPNDLEGARLGEARTLAAFRADPLGDSSDLLFKRIQRDPFHRIAPYPVGVEDLEAHFRSIDKIEFPRLALFSADSPADAPAS